MKLFVAFTFLALFAVAFAAPAAELDDPEDAEITEWVNERKEDGSYHVRSATSDGVLRDEVGKLVLAGKDEDNEDIYAYVVEGFYQYVAPDGQLIRTDYRSTKEGFEAKGDHIPEIDHEAYDAILDEQARVVAEQERLGEELLAAKSGLVRGAQQSSKVVKQSYYESSGVESVPLAPVQASKAVLSAGSSLAKAGKKANKKVRQ